MERRVDQALRSSELTALAYPTTVIAVAILLPEAERLLW